MRLKTAQFIEMVQLTNLGQKQRQATEMHKVHKWHYRYSNYHKIATDKACYRQGHTAFKTSNKEYGPIISPARNWQLFRIKKNKFVCEFFLGNRLA